MPKKPNYTNSDIIALNSIGLSLGFIGKTLGLHQSTVGNRLRKMGIEPADTRRTFMEDIVKELTQEQREQLIFILGSGFTIKDYVKNLIIVNLLDQKTKKGKTWTKP